MYFNVSCEYLFHFYYFRQNCKEPFLFFFLFFFISFYLAQEVTNVLLYIVLIE